MAFVLKQIVPWGRSFKEYVRMFNLTKKDLRSKIVSCGDGPAGFNVEMKKRGYEVVSCDPIYKFSAQQIKSQIDKIYDSVIKQLEDNRRDYVWESFKSPEALGRIRMQAMRDFLMDYSRGKKEGRYVAQRLPKLSFKDGQFDIALCSHFLFLYTGRLSFSFHMKAIAEMLRVAREVRIFPLLELGGKKSPYVKEAIKILREKGYKVAISRVDYEFQRNGNKMLRATKVS